MRIFMLVQHPEGRGPVPKLTAHLVGSLRSGGCVVVTHPWGREKESESLRHKLSRGLRDVWSVRRSLQQESFDVAVVQTSHDWRTLLRDIPLALVIRRRGRPVILQLHGSRVSNLAAPGGHAFKLASALLLALVDGILVLSTEEQRGWQAFRGRPPVFVVKNPYVRTFSAQSDRASAPPGTAQALFVGRLIHEKGIFEAVEALPQVLEKTQCELVVVGEGEQEQGLLARIEQLGLGDHVTMTGYLTGSALADAYRAATIFVFPTYWNEGFPTVLTEAMDAGLPIVTTGIRGAADHLVAGENALLVAPRDVKALASAMTTLLTDGELRDRITSENEALIDMFEPAAVAAEYFAILQSVTGDFGKDSADS